MLEALHKTGREDLIGYGKHCLIRPGKGPSSAAQGEKEGRRAVPGKKSAAPARGKGKPGKSGKAPKGFDGRHAVEKKSGAGKPVRKAGWAKPKKKK